MGNRDDPTRMIVPRISLCVIARNEAERLPRCLRSAVGAVDEVIVVDTGSTDGTAEVARELGARVSSFQWCDDFAAARNAALEAASGDWILWLDADEELLPESVPLVRELVGREEALAYYVYGQQAEHPEQTGDFVEMRHLRLFRNDPALRFIGRCHPHFGGALAARERETGRRVLDSAVPIRHWGYLPELMPAKLERAARLLQAELKERPGQLYYEIELGRTWAALGDPRGAELLPALLDRVLGDASPQAPSALAAPLLEYGLRHGGLDDGKRRQVEAAALRWFPASPPLLAAAAECHFRRGEYREALTLYARLARLAETGAYDRSLPCARHYLEDGPLLHLAVCHHYLGELEEAEAAYRRLETRYPGHPAARENLEILRRQREMPPPPAGRKPRRPPRTSGKRRR